METAFGYIDFEQLNEIEEISGVGSYELDLVKGKVHCSRQMLKILEIEPGESLTDLNDFFQMVYPEDLEVIRNNLREHAKNPGVYATDFRIKTKSGQTKYIIGRVRYLANEGEIATHLIGSAQDISDVKSLEKKVKETEKRFAILGDNIPGVIYLCRNDERYSMLYLNDHVETITGYSKDEFLENIISFVDLYHPDDRERIIQEVDESLRKKKPFNLYYRIIDKKGQIHWIEELGVGVYENGKLEYLEGYLSDVTERRDNERKLKESEERLNLALRAATIGIFDWNPETDTLNIDERVRKFLGVPQTGNSLNIQDFYQALNDVDLKAVREKVDHVLSISDREGQFEFEFNIRDYKESLHTLAVQGSLLRDESGNPARVIGCFIDITGRKHYEQLLESINEAIKDGIYKSIPNGSFIYVNKAFVNMFGYDSAEEMLKVRPGDLYVDQKERDRIQSLFKRNQSIFNNEVLLRRKDGTQFWGMLSSTLVKEADGQEYFNGTIRDISELKEAEIKLIEQKERNERILETTINGYLLFEEDGYILDTNPAFCSMIGYSKTELTEMSFFDLSLRSTRKKLQDNINTLFKKDFLKFETELQGKNGNVIDFEVSGSLTYYNQKKFVVCFLQDISQRKQAEQMAEAHQNELKEALRSLSERNFELDQLVYKVSHDLRSPLSSILGIINVISVEKDAQKKEEYIDLIANRVTKLDNFVTSMLNYAKANRSELITEEINFDALIDNALADLEYLEDFKNVKVTRDLRIKTTMISDPVRLQLIFSNVISNAYKYQNRHSDDNHLKISVSVTKQNAVIGIRDNGVGIPEDLQKRVFEMFFRASEKSDGSGLGMYIVKQSVDKLGGTINLKSELGKGTEIKLMIPNRN